MRLLPWFDDPPARPAVSVPDGTLSFRQLRDAAAVVSADLTPGQRVMVPVAPDLATVVAVVGGLAAGATVVPVNAHSGERELGHQVTDADPVAVVCSPDADLNGPLGDLPRVDVLPSAPSGADGAVAPGRRAEGADDGPPGTSGRAPDEPDPDDPALIMYTSGTTGLPKGAVLSRGAVAANLDALAAVWNWTPSDVLVHSLPLYHVHGLVLGVLGSLRVGGRLHHLGRFDAARTARALADGGTMMFGVPTMYGRLADLVEADAASAAALRSARLLVSGSAGLPPSVRDRLLAATGHWVVERYGMTETLILTAAPTPPRSSVGHADAQPCAGPVGPPLPGVEVRVVDDDGEPVPPDGRTMGQVVARTPALFSGYRNRPDATATLVRDGWAHTGDVAVRHADGSLTIVGRQSTDIIKTGGFKVGAGEVEDALLDHPAVAEAAVMGRPDDDLGQRIEAWVVLELGSVDGRGIDAVLIDHVAGLLSPHKRPRAVHVVDSLPRNAMGKVQKQQLDEPAT